MTIPDGVVSLEEVQRLKDAEIANDDIRLRFVPDQRSTSFGAGEVERMTARAAAEARYGCVDLFRGAAIDDHLCAGLVKPTGDGKPNALGRSGDEGDFA